MPKKLLGLITSLFIFGIAHAELPYYVDDTPIMENDEHLDQRVSLIEDQYLDTTGSTQTKTGGLNINSSLSVASLTVTAGTALFGTSGSSVVISAGEIGVAADPEARLHVIMDSNGIILQRLGSPSGKFAIGVFGANNTLSVTDLANNISRFQIDPGAISGARVSIGSVTSSDSADSLSIYSPTSHAIRMNNNANASPFGFIINQNTDGSIDIFNVSAGTMSFGTSNATRYALGTSAITTGGALCLNSDKILKKCTSAVDASGNCTCP